MTHKKTTKMKDTGTEGISEVRTNVFVNTLGTKLEVGKSYYLGVNQGETAYVTIESFVITGGVIHARGNGVTRLHKVSMSGLWSVQQMTQEIAPDVKAKVFAMANYSFDSNRADDFLSAKERKNEGFHRLLKFVAKTKQSAFITELVQYEGHSDDMAWLKGLTAGEKKDNK